MAKAPDDRSSSDGPAEADTPTVSIVMPTWNEARHLDATLSGLIEQDLDEPVEILVVDGGSTDGTIDIIERYAAEHRGPSRRVRLLNNPNRVTPPAFNIGIRAAEGRYIAIMGAHAKYPTNYLSACLACIRAHLEPVAASGGIVTLPGADTWSARIVVAALTSSFGSSKRSFRTHASGPADTIPFPVVERRFLEAIGGYDERLLRAEDNDLSARLIESGVTLVFVEALQAGYVARATFPAMAKLAWRNGWWAPKAIALGGRGIRIRHLAPGIAVAGALPVVAAAVTGAPFGRRLPTALGTSILVTHQVLGYASSAGGPTDRLATGAAIGLLHGSYGIGTVASAVAHVGGLLRRLASRGGRA